MSDVSVRATVGFIITFRKRRDPSQFTQLPLGDSGGFGAGSPGSDQAPPGRGGVHHIWGCDHYKTTLNAFKFKQAYKKRTDLVKDAMLTVPYGDRDAMVKAITDAIKKGGLFAVDVDIVPTKIGEACHVWLPAATSGEANLTSMNGERRMRLTERYMDPPGQAMADCLIAARIANHMERVLREQDKAKYADQFKGFDWKTEEDAFMDGYHAHEKGGEFVTYDRLRALGTNGFQEPAVGYEGGKIVGTKRLYADGKFKGSDGKAVFTETAWRGLQAPGMSSDAAYVSSILNTIDGPIILVGHSYGGAVITNAANGNQSVKALVYVAAFAPDIGESVAALLRRFPGSTVEANTAAPILLADGSRDLYFQPDKFRAQYAADLPETETRLLALTQLPFAERVMTDVSDRAAWKSIPSWFIFGTRDNSIPANLLAFMAERAGSKKTVTIEGASHAVMMSHADAVVELVEQAASAVRCDPA